MIYLDGYTLCPQVLHFQQLTNTPRPWNKALVGDKVTGGAPWAAPASLLPMHRGWGSRSMGGCSVFSQWGWESFESRVEAGVGQDVGPRAGACPHGLARPAVSRRGFCGSRHPSDWRHKRVDMPVLGRGPQRGCRLKSVLPRDGRHWDGDRAPGHPCRGDRALGPTVPPRSPPWPSRCSESAV